MRLKQISKEDIKESTETNHKLADQEELKQISQDMHRTMLTADRLMRRLELILDKQKAP
jgi:hypothetical protein